MTADGQSRSAHLGPMTAGAAARAGVLLTLLASTACAANAAEADGSILDSAQPDIGAADTLPWPDSSDGCPGFSPGEIAGRISSGLVDEASGIAASRANPGVLWVHNDAGNLAQLFAVSSAGQLLGVYNLSGVVARDWEDIAVGPGPGGGWYVYIGDIGDNLAARTTVVVHRVPEPAVDSARPLSEPVELSDFETLELRYPVGTHDAETLLVDPTGGAIYIVTKSELGHSRFFVHDPGSASTTDQPAWLQLVATVFLGSSGISGGGKELTGGDISPAGDELLLRTKRIAFLWPWPAGGLALDKILATEPCRVSLQVEPQGEAIAFDAAGAGFYSLSEGVSQPLYYYRRLSR